MKTIADLVKIAEADGWKIDYELNDSGNSYIYLNQDSPAGQDFQVELVFDGSAEPTKQFTEGFIEALAKYIEEYDVCYETYIWLDSSGHGKNGAPDDMMDVYNDMLECKKMMETLLADWRTALANK